MAWIEKTIVNVSDPEPDEEEIETSEKRLRDMFRSMPPFIKISSRRAREALVKYEAFKQRYIENLRNNAVYKFVMQVAAFTNEDMEKYWRGRTLAPFMEEHTPDDIKIEKEDVELLVSRAREHAFADLHQFCRPIEAIPMYRPSVIFPRKKEIKFTYLSNKQFTQVLDTAESKAETGTVQVISRDSDVLSGSERPEVMLLDYNFRITVGQRSQGLVMHIAEYHLGVDGKIYIRLEGYDKDESEYVDEYISIDKPVVDITEPKYIYNMGDSEFLQFYKKFLSEKSVYGEKDVFDRIKGRNRIGRYILGTTSDGKKTKTYPAEFFGEHSIYKKDIENDTIGVLEAYEKLQRAKQRGEGKAEIKDLELEFERKTKASVERIIKERKRLAEEIKGLQELIGESSTFSTFGLQGQLERLYTEYNVKLDEWKKILNNCLTEYSMGTDLSEDEEEEEEEEGGGGGFPQPSGGGGMRVFWGAVDDNTEEIPIGGEVKADEKMGKKRKRNVNEDARNNPIVQLKQMLDDSGPGVYDHTAIYRNGKRRRDDEKDVPNEYDIYDHPEYKSLELDAKDMGFWDRNVPVVRWEDKRPEFWFQRYVARWLAEDRETANPDLDDSHVHFQARFRRLFNNLRYEHGRWIRDLTGLRLTRMLRGSAEKKSKYKTGTKTEKKTFGADIDGLGNMAEEYLKKGNHTFETTTSEKVDVHPAEEYEGQSSSSRPGEVPSEVPLDFVEPLFNERFAFWKHNLVLGEYEKRSQYQADLWLQKTPWAIGKLYLMPAIVGHMMEAHVAITTRFPGYNNVELMDLLDSERHSFFFSKLVAMCIRTSAVLSGKKYGLDKAYMRLNLEKRRLMFSLSKLGVPKRSRSGRTVEYKSSSVTRGKRRAFEDARARGDTAMQRRILQGNY